MARLTPCNPEESRSKRTFYPVVIIEVFADYDAKRWIMYPATRVYCSQEMVVKVQNLSDNNL